jgi:hypothetical protein
MDLLDAYQYKQYFQPYKYVNINCRENILINIPNYESK